MKPKKSEKANLEKNRGMYFQLGLIVSLCISLAAFEWASPVLEKQERVYIQNEEIIIENPWEEITVKQETAQPKQQETQGTSLDTLKVIDNKSEKKPLDLDSLMTTLVIDGGDTKGPTLDTAVKFIDGNINFSGYQIDKMPEFPGGFEALNKYLKENTKIPPSVTQIGQNQKFHIQFVVDYQGNIRDVEFAGGKATEQMKREAYRVVKSLPKWEPGVKDGQPVSVIYHVPFNIVIR